MDWKDGGGDLLRPIRLSSVMSWKERAQPTEAWSERYGGQFALAMEFVEASLQQRVAEVEKEARVQQQLFLKNNGIKALGLALLVAIILVGWALSQRNSARKQFGKALVIKAQSEWRSHKPLSFWPFAISFRNYDKQSALGSNQPRPAIRVGPGKFTTRAK